MNKMMNRTLLACLIFLTPLMVSAQKKGKWTPHLEQRMINYRMDSSKWDFRLFKEDSPSDSTMAPRELFPFPLGAFPVPQYDLAEKFRYSGGASNGFQKIFQGKRINGFYLSGGKTEASRIFLKEKKDEVFFVILYIRSEKDSTKDFKWSSNILSRNSPDYTCRGYFTGNKVAVDFLAFLTPNRDAYAIVDMRIFNLKFGRLVLIAPQKDRTLRSYQVSIPLLSSEEMESYLDKVLYRKDVKSFILKYGNL
jgi:hypothetical protein